VQAEMVKRMMTVKKNLLTNMHTPQTKDTY
jgi:hypothetical protein